MTYTSMTVVALSAVTRLRRYEWRNRFRTPSPEHALAMVARWCQWACPRLGLQIEVDGALPAARCVYVANHRTYLDIPVLTAVLGATFLSRADIADWPVFGTVARLTHTVMIARDDTHDRMRAARALLRRLRTASVVVFPEGTTTGERLPMPFQSGLFRLLQRSDVPVVPVTMRYDDRRVYWIEDLTMAQHMATRVLRRPALRVMVHVGSSLSGADFADADAFAAAVYAAVCEPIERRGELV